MHGFLKRLIPAVLCLVLLCSTALAYVTLEKGDRGSDVLHMQQALSDLGYTVGADGVFGTQTRNVVKAFQRDHNLKVDGKAGNETLTLLYALQAQLSQAAAPIVTQAPVAPSTAAPAAANTATVYCADGGKLNLRAGAGSGYKVLAQIPTGTVLAVTEPGSKWTSVRYNGESGYVMTSFLRFDGTAAVTPSPVPSDGQGNVLAIVTCADGGKLNLRHTASSGAKILERIPNGTVLTVLNRGSKWCTVSYNGSTGYVMTSFLDFAIQPVITATPAPETAAPVTQAPVAVTPTPVPTAVPVYNALVYCSDGGSLNLRKSASSSAKVLDRIPSGTPLNVTAVDSKWSSVTYNGQFGYVMNKYLIQQTDQPFPTAAPIPGTQGGMTATVTCSNGKKLNLREGAGTAYKVLYQIPNGSRVNVIVRGATWSQVSTGDYTGYVMSSYLTFEATAPTATPAPTATAIVTATPVPTAAPDGLRYEEFRYATVKTTNGSLNIRKGPGTNYARVSEIKDGTQVVVSAIEGEWCALYYGDVQGYAMKQYLVIQEPSGTAEETSKYDTSILTRVLREGYTGADVDLVQARLMELKYLAVASGTYDAVTMTAVRNFQNQNGLTVDGLAGSNTCNLLFSDGAFPYNTGTGSYSSYVMDYEGNTSTAKTAAVLAAQKALRELNYNVPLTGAFEARTHDAIVAFQLRNGITASGILDAATQSRLYSGTAHDVAWPSRYYLPEGAGTSVSAPTDVQLLHWSQVVSPALSGAKSVTAYDPDTGLSWRLSIMSRGRHLDVQPTSLEDTLIQKKSFGSTSWDIHPVYILLPDGRWSMAAMHDYPHGSNTIMNNGFGGQNCVHFLRDMSEAQANDPNYGVRNQEVLRDAWYKLTGVKVE